jgi:hypothetical protein
MLGSRVVVTELLLLALISVCAPIAAGAAPSTAGESGEHALQDPRPPFPFTPRHLGRVWRAAGQRETLLELGTGVLAAAAVYPLDDEISDRFVEQEPLGHGAVNTGRDIGHRKYVALASAALVLSGQVIGSRRVRDTGFLYLESNLLTAGLTQLFKVGVGRKRPDESNKHSFPSGHASATMASARVLQKRLGWWVGVPAYAAATYVGLSRIQGNKHFPSDVIFGWALGFYVSSAVVRADEPAGRERGAENDGASWLPMPEPGDLGQPLVRVRF